GRFNIISMHHEQAAAFAAEGIARKTMGRQIAVAMGTSGPGATNLITGIGDCWLDSVPCLFITGQVNSYELKGNRAIRQQGFQELDIVPMVASITKYAVQVTDPDKLLPELHQALSIARDGRQGPVLIDIPNDVQRMDIPDAKVEEWLATPLWASDPSTPSEADINLLRALCAVAERPLVCIGGGARWAQALVDWLGSLEANGIPYVTTLMGHERVTAGPCYFNLIGSYGNREANWAVQNCDLLIVIGARLDVRQTGADTNDFARHARVVQVDIDPAQLSNRVQAELPICCDADAFFRGFAVEPDTFPEQKNDWLKRLTTLRTSFDRDEYADWAISPGVLFKRFNLVMSGKAVDYVCDVGNHQMWAAQNLRLQSGQAAHYSGGMGTMGFALPTALGIALCSGHKAIVVTGDGSLQINIQELDTLKRMQLDVTVVVLNNHSLGMVKNFQDMYFDGRNQSTKTGYSAPSFVALAKAYEIEHAYVENREDMEDALQKIAETNRPFLLEVGMPYASECRPRLAFGKKLDEQFPYIEMDESEKNR
ncbi:MAG: thiamine pyrophosphate-binding protein, partial [Gammaproteobacteria bacterium]|nr:thiamine pyrophosphate-binding protein [Gammaproteobacteria bacterium]